MLLKFGAKIALTGCRNIYQCWLYAVYVGYTAYLGYTVYVRYEFMSVTQLMSVTNFILVTGPYVIQVTWGWGRRHLQKMFAMNSLRKAPKKLYDILQFSQVKYSHKKDVQCMERKHPSCSCLLY